MKREMLYLAMGVLCGLVVVQFTGCPQKQQQPQPQEKMTAGGPSVSLPIGNGIVLRDRNVDTSIAGLGTLSISVQNNMIGVRFLGDAPRVQMWRVYSRQPKSLSTRLQRLGLKRHSLCAFLSDSNASE